MADIIQTGKSREFRGKIKNFCYYKYGLYDVQYVPTIEWLVKTLSADNGSDKWRQIESRFDNDDIYFLNGNEIKQLSRTCEMFFPIAIRKTCWRGREE